MSELEFLLYKKKLNVILSKYIKDVDLKEIKDPNILVSILNQYTYRNRLEMKGLISHTILDSLEIDDIIAEEFLKFDQKIE